MTRLVILCLAWMVLSAVTAYFADIWGRRLGKQRKTIGRLRPKHTAIVIICSAGALIALLSFVVLLTADAGIRRALLHWDQTLAEKRALESQLVIQKRDLDAKIAAQQSALDASTAVINSAESRVKIAQGRLALARKELAGRQSELASVQAKLTGMRAEVAAASQQLAQARTSLQQTRARLAGLNAQLSRGYGVLTRQYADIRQSQAALERSLAGERAARKGDELARVVIPKGVSLTQAREKLRRLLNDASLVVQQRSKDMPYGPDKKFVIIPIRSVFQRVNGKLVRVTLSAEKSMELVAMRLADPDDPDIAPGGTVVRVVALESVTAGETVPVDFRLAKNHVVFDKDDVIVSFTVKSSDSKPDVMGRLTGCLADVRAKASENGLIPQADGSVGSPPLYQLADVFSLVQQAFHEGQKTVTVRVLALRETWTSDELKLRFQVQRYSDGT